MKLNIHILFEELKNYAPVLKTTRENEFFFQKIRFLDTDIGDLQKGCIYLARAEEIEKHFSFLEEVDLISVGPISVFPEKLANLSVIILPEMENIITVFNQVQDIFLKYEQWDYALIRMIAEHESLQAIADHAATMLKNPFALLDITLKRILVGGKIPDHYKGTAWESIMDNEYTPSETFSMSRDDLYFFLSYNNKPYFVHGAPYQYSHLMANIYLNHKLFALIATTDINGPFSQSELTLIGHVRDVMELAISSSMDFKDIRETVVYYLEKLLKGFPVDEKIINYHLNQRNWRQYDKFRLYTIVNPEGKELSESQAEFCLFRIRNLHEDAVVFCYENAIIVVARRATSSENHEYEKRLRALAKKLEMQCGYSSVFDHFIDLKYYYIQSKAALYEGQKDKSAADFWCFETYYFAHLIDAVNNSASLKSLCHPGVLRLQEHDQKEKTDLVHCLRIYLFNGCNIAQTGKALFMHRNTLTYRLEKIADIIELDVRQLDENARMQIWFSCLITSYL